VQLALRYCDWEEAFAHWDTLPSVGSLMWWTCESLLRVGCMGLIGCNIILPLDEHRTTSRNEGVDVGCELGTEAHCSACGAACPAGVHKLY